MKDKSRLKFLIRVFDDASKGKYPKFYSTVLLALLFVALPGTGGSLFSQDLTIGPGDLRIGEQTDSGFHLFIRKKADIGSVLLTESTRDPAMVSDNFALRAPERNPVNGDEIRLLNGVPLSRESGIFSLIDSTPESHAELGEAFQIFIPWVVYYGYENGRHGEIRVGDGTYLNIRSFRLPYADYRNTFADNPFLIRAAQKRAGTYMEDAEKAFREIADGGEGKFIYASNPVDLIVKIEDLLREQTGKSVDIVLCLDTTGSMDDYIDGVREMLIPKMREIIGEFTEFRIGMVFYKDHSDYEYVNKIYPFTRDFSSFQRDLNAITVRGGGDIPEAVYEALYEGADKFDWAAESRLLVLIGDAPPQPRGPVSADMVYRLAAEKGIKVSAIILPE